MNKKFSHINIIYYILIYHDNIQMVNSQLNNFDHNHTEVKINQFGGKIIRKVSIKKGKGYKSISNYHKKTYRNCSQKA